MLIRLLNFNKVVLCAVKTLKMSLEMVNACQHLICHIDYNLHVNHCVVKYHNVCCCYLSKTKWLFEFPIPYQKYLVSTIEKFTEGA